MTGTQHLTLRLRQPYSLVPSSTSGHGHLYLDTPLTWRRTKRLLKALGRAGVLEAGFVRVSIRRRATHARLPWVTKGHELVEPGRRTGLISSLRASRGFTAVDFAVPGTLPRVLHRKEVWEQTDIYGTHVREVITETSHAQEAHLASSRLAGRGLHALILDLDVPHGIDRATGTLTVKVPGDTRAARRVVALMGKYGMLADS